MDAVRIADAQLMVAIKHISISAHPHESEIALYLSSPPLSNDPRNHSRNRDHCCPILYVLEDPLDDDQRFIVVPLLRAYDERKSTIPETNSGIAGPHFMHEHHVAHRNITKSNIMMDAKPILPETFHPRSPSRTLRDRSKHARRPHTRTALPVRYYFTDVGQSKRYSAHSESETETAPSELPIHAGRRQDCPCCLSSRTHPLSRESHPAYH